MLTHLKFCLILSATNWIWLDFICPIYTVLYVWSGSCLILPDFDFLTCDFCLVALLPYCLSTFSASPLTPISKSLGSLDLRFHPPSTRLGVSFLGYPIVPLVSCRPLLPFLFGIYISSFLSSSPSLLPPLQNNSVIPTHTYPCIEDRLHLLPRTCLPLAPPPSSHTLPMIPLAGGLPILPFKLVAKTILIIMTM
jgi:hypothetical protein